MLDYYLVVVPGISLLALLNLIVLKLAVKDNTTIFKILTKKKQIHHQENINIEESSSKNTLKFILLNFTPLEFCAVRRAKFKLSFFLSLAMILVATYFIPSPYAFVGTGTIVYFLYFLITMAITRSSPEGQQEYQCKKYKQKYMQIVFTILSLGLNFLMVGVIYKNYKNSQIISFLGNAGLNIAFDNFLVRPTLSLLIGLPLSLNATFYSYVQECQQEITLLETFETVGEKKIFEHPGKHISPTKIPNSIPLEFEIEPRPYTQESRSDEGKEKVMELLKKIKKEKMLPPINSTIEKGMEGEASLDSLFNSSKKDQHSQREENDIFERVEEPILQQEEEVTFQKGDQIPIHNPTSEGINDTEEDLPIKKKVCSDNCIVINPSLQEQAQNQEDIETQNIKSKNKESAQNEEGGYEDEYAFRKKAATFQVGDEPLKISLQSSENPTSRQQPLRICINGQINLEHEENHSDEEDIDNFKKRKEMMTIEEGKGRSQPFGVLEINQKHNQSEEIEEIDLNSPERRRKNQLHVELQQQSKISMIHKKKKKKLSHDHQNRVIKFSTGEPYLEYLPNMLSKEKNKKSQGFNRKDVSNLDSRLTSSVKRPTKKKYGQNNQNIVPQFKIQEL